MQEYADTSFLVSLYVFDSNTSAANAYAKAWKRPPLLPFTPFSAFELNNTLHRARALDVLHLANAKICGARVLLSFDNGQRAAAVDLGLRVAP